MWTGSYQLLASAGGGGGAGPYSYTPGYGALTGTSGGDNGASSVWKSGGSSGAGARNVNMNAASSTQIYAGFGGGGWVSDAVESVQSNRRRTGCYWCCRWAISTFARTTQPGKGRPGLFLGGTSGCGNKDGGFGGGGAAGPGGGGGGGGYSGGAGGGYVNAYFGCYYTRYYYGTSGGWGGGSYKGPSTLFGSAATGSQRETQDGVVMFEREDVEAATRVRTCGATGQTGPTSTLCNPSYQSALMNPDGMYVTTVNGVQHFRIQRSGVYKIKAGGGKGADSSRGTGGFGATVEGTFFLTTGTELRIVVGHKGSVGTQTYTGGGGGGGTFVWINGSTTPLLVAGGGGGGARYGGNRGAPGQAAFSGSQGHAQSGRAGTNGGGANGYSTNSGGGTGWYSGGSCSPAAFCGQGRLVNTPFLGGAYDTGTAWANGGFGGGGGARYGGGGGGGYSGGKPCVHYVTLYALA